MHAFSANMDDDIIFLGIVTASQKKRKLDEDNEILVSFKLSHYLIG